MKWFFYKIREKRSKKKFRQNSLIVSNDVALLAGAHCQNTGAPQMVEIGTHCTIGCLLQALFGGRIAIGNNTYIGTQTIIQSKESVSIGNNVMISNNVLIVDNNNHPIEPEMRLKMSACEDFMNDELWSWKYAESKPVIIEDNVWIGRDSRILKGVTVGKGSIVALGSIVTKDVPPYTIVAGNPAKVVKHLTPPENNE